MKLKHNLLYKIRICLVILAVISSITSCKKFVEVGIPAGQLGVSEGFSDSLTSLSSVLSLYGYYYTTGLNDFIMSVNRAGAMSADEGYYFNNTTYDNFKNNTLGIGNETEMVYNDPYYLINIANNNLAGLEATTGISASFKKQLTGEVKFWRAYLYYFLVNYFGGVPLAVNTNALTNALLAKSTPQQVWNQIQADLVDAKALLTDNYPSIERARVNKKAASALLARVYLYQGNYIEAEKEASEVISASATYKLEPNLDNVFIKTSNEVIWQVANNTGVTRMGASFIPAATTPSFVLLDTLVNTFAPGDKRKASWTKSLVTNGITYYYPFKYKLRTGTTGNEYAVMLRLSEQYLIRSEARLRQSNKTGAIADVDSIRKRAGLPLLVNTNPTIADAALQDTIDHERWVELFTETSDRWFNLKRRGKAAEVLKLIKPLWNDRQLLYPFPLNDTNANINLIQNTGYER